MCDVCIAELDSGHPKSCLFDKIIAVCDSDPDYANVINYLRAASDVAVRALLRTKCNLIQHHTLDEDLRLYVRNDMD